MAIADRTLTAVIDARRREAERRAARRRVVAATILDRGVGPQMSWLLFWQLRYRLADQVALFFGYRNDLRDRFRPEAPQRPAFGVCSCGRSYQVTRRRQERCHSCLERQVVSEATHGA